MFDKTDAVNGNINANQILLQVPVLQLKQAARTCSIYT